MNSLMMNAGCGRSLQSLYWFHSGSGGDDLYLSISGSAPLPGNEQTLCDPVIFGSAASARAAGIKTGPGKLIADAIVAAESSRDASDSGQEVQAPSSTAGKERKHHERGRHKRGGKHGRH